MRERCSSWKQRIAEKITKHPLYDPDIKPAGMVMIPVGAILHGVASGIYADPSNPSPESSLAAAGILVCLSLYWWPVSTLREDRRWRSNP